MNDKAGIQMIHAIDSPTALSLLMKIHNKYINEIKT